MIKEGGNKEKSRGLYCVLGCGRENIRMFYIKIKWNFKVKKKGGNNFIFFF
jgi:hypothetical protein